MQYRDPTYRPVVFPLAGSFLLIIAVLSALWLSQKQEAAAHWVRHTLQVEKQLHELQLLITQAETGQRGFLLTGKEEFLDPYHQASTDLPRSVEALKALVQDNPRQMGDYPRLQALIHDRLDQLATNIALARLDKNAEAVSKIRSGQSRQTMQAISTLIGRMVAEEERLLESRTVVSNRLILGGRLTLILAMTLAAALAYYVISESRKRIRQLSSAYEQLQEQIVRRDSAESQLRQLQKMEAVGQLTGGIAHDFNNMLAIVIGSLDLGRRRLTGAEHPRVTQAFDNALEGAQRAASLTARLLAFSRQQPLEPKILDANKLVGAMSELLRRTLGENVRVETVLAGGLWRTSADPSQLENAIVNLAVNARDAMPDGGRLTIETSNSDLDDRYAREHHEVTAGQYVLISVTDTGTGMSQEVIDRAFDPFYTTKGMGKGTGLGLSQVFGFIKQSGGHIKVYSEISQGTTVKLYLPRYVGSGAVAESWRAEDGAIPMGNVDEIILVVEDETEVRHMSVDALRELGYTVVQASDGNQALEQLALQPRVDLLFTDIIMPDMTGRQLADKAVEQRPKMKVLYTTGYTRNAVVHNGVVDHGVSFLAKPFTVDALARKVREVLDGD